jgi:hypothetical protein
MRMGRGQVRALLAGSAGKVFRRMGEGSGRAATGDARGVADEKARSLKAREGICRKVINVRSDREIERDRPDVPRRERVQIPQADSPRAGEEQRDQHPARIEYAVLGSRWIDCIGCMASSGLSPWFFSLPCSF